MTTTIDPAAAKEAIQQMSDFAAEEYQRGKRDGRSQIEQELADVKAGYRMLDRNWDAVHKAAMTPIREALGLPDGTVPELLERIERLKRAAVKEELAQN